MPSADNMLLLTMFQTNFIRRLGSTGMQAGRGPALIVVTEHSDEHDRNP